MEYDFPYRSIRFSFRMTSKDVSSNARKAELEDRVHRYIRLGSDVRAQVQRKNHAAS